MICSDGIIGKNTFNAIIGKNIKISENPWNCPNCGGNQTEIKNGKKICAYCGSELLTKKKT